LKNNLRNIFLCITINFQHIRKKILIINSDFWEYIVLINGITVRTLMSDAKNTYFQLLFNVNKSLKLVLNLNYLFYIQKNIGYQRYSSNFLHYYSLILYLFKKLGTFSYFVAFTYLNMIRFVDEIFPDFIYIDFIIIKW